MNRHFRPWLSAAAVMLVTIAASAAPSKNLTVADALQSWRFGGNVPRDIIWAPDGRTFFYFKAGSPREASDLMRFDTADLSRHIVLTQDAYRKALAGLEGITEAQEARADFRTYEVSPEGPYLLLSTPKGLLCWNLAVGKLSRLSPKKLGKVDNAAWSPDGTRVAFTSGADLWVADRASGEAHRLVAGGSPLVTCGSVDWLYGEELDMTTGYWWSPDGSRIAYLRFDEAGVPTYPIIDQTQINPAVKKQFYPKPGEQNPSVTLRVVTLDGKDSAVTGAGSGEGYLTRVAWFPDGKALSFEIINRNQNHLVLYRSNLNDKAPVSLLEEKHATWVNVLGRPRFINGGRSFLWLSERDGYEHIYLYDLAKKSVKRLTEGPWVVDSILGVNEKTGWVYFDGNRESPLGRQLYKVNFKGRMERVSEGTGWHDATFSPGAGAYVDAHSSAGTPPVVTLHLIKSRKTAVIAANPAPELAEYGFVKPEFIKVRADDGTVLYARVIKPKDFDPHKKYAAVVEVYGGPDYQMVQNRWVGRWDTVNQLFAENGFVYFSIDNRGSTRRGKAFEDVLYKRMGKVELEDQLAGLKALKALPYVDGNRVGIWGWSYGGFMTCYTLTHAPKGDFACGLAVAPVTDWLNYDTCYTERYLKLPKDDRHGYRNSSPVHFAKDLKGNFFLAQGLVDNNVHFGNSVQLVDALYKAHKSFQLAYYPRMSHGIRGPDARLDLFTHILHFFEQQLEPGNLAGSNRE